MMERYSMYTNRDGIAEMVGQKHGDWVLFEEADSELEKLRDELDDANNARLSMGRHIDDLECEINELNMARKHIRTR